MKPRWTMYTRPNHILYSTMSVWPVWLYWGEEFLQALAYYRAADKYMKRKKHRAFIIKRYELKVMAEAIVKYDREIEQ